LIKIRKVYPIWRVHGIQFGVDGGRKPWSTPVIRASNSQCSSVYGRMKISTEILSGDGYYARHNLAENNGAHVASIPPDLKLIISSLK
jgi:hypothetical protein